MKKQYERIGRNVVFGYILLAIIALVSISYLYNIVEKIAAEEDVNTVPRQKIYLVTNTQALLYESETMGQLIDMPEDDYTYFNETLDKAQDNMEAFRALVTDTLFHQKIDTIQVLIERKRMNTEQLLSIWKMANADLYEKSIRKALETKSDDVKETAVKEQVNVKQDTVIVQPGKKKTFFRRLAEVFVPGEVGDSSIRVSANQQVVKDTLVNTYNPDEAISKTLRNIQSSVAGERERLRILLVDRSSALRYDNSSITARINQMLRSMEEEELDASLQRLQKRQDILEKTSYLISVIALISLGVAIFFLFFIGRDLSKSKYYRKQLEKEKKYTEDLLNSREKLILTIGHDIRAPLSSIIGYTELLQRSFPDEKQRMYLRNMSGSSNHILSLVNDLLDFQRLDSGQMEVHEIPFKVPALFHEIYHSFEPQAVSKGLKLAFSMGDVSDCVYMGDSIRIRQITGNLLSNALKFTNEGAVELMVDCQQTDPLTQTALLSVTVSDTGSGIPVAEQERIFAEFTRLPGAEKTEGFGLGLSITHKLTTLLGGTISLQSREGEGSRFTVTLPLAVSENQALPDAPAGEVPDTIPFADRSVTCLIVDDDLLQIVLMEEILKQNHIHVVSCTNPRLVLDMLKKASFDMVITDIQMPGMDGYDLIRQIRSSDLPDAATRPVVALSATVGSDHTRYQEAGFTDSLSKPFTSEELISLLKKILPDMPDAGKHPDFSSLTFFAGEDKDASANILRTFTSETRRHLELLEQALATSDRELSERISHKLVPLFTMLGSHILVQQLRILERDDVELSDSGWKHLLTDVIRQVRTVVNDAEVGNA